MKCPSCQTDISDDSQFCSRCGTPVQAAERIVFSQTRTILRSMEELAPETLLAGKYRILKVAGRGGWGSSMRLRILSSGGTWPSSFFPPSWSSVRKRGNGSSRKPGGRRPLPSQYLYNL